MGRIGELYSGSEGEVEGGAGIPAHLYPTQYEIVFTV